MKSPAAASLLWTVAILLGVTTAGEATLATGGTAYTKRRETTLLTEPAPLAAPAGTLAFGRTLTVEEIRGRWLRVSDGPVAGWVFAGNLSETKPVETKGLDGLGLSASNTTATAAARPLTPAAAEYAVRNNLVNARDDLDWLRGQGATVTPEVLEEFLQSQKKGEFQ